MTPNLQHILILKLLLFYQINLGLSLKSKAPLFVAKTGSGQKLNLTKLYKKNPIFLYFIGESCPINNKALPLIKKICSSYNNSSLPFYGIINTEGQDYLDWQKTYSMPFEIFLDPYLKIVKIYDVIRSPWIIKIDQKGKISKVWKGYSQSSLNELNNELADILKTKPVKIDFSSAPKKLLGGCAFY